MQKSLRKGIFSRLTAAATAVLTALSSVGPISTGITASAENVKEFTYPTATSLGSVEKYAAFASSYHQENHMEGNFACENYYHPNGDAFGASDNVKYAIDPNENYIYIKESIGLGQDQENKELPNFRQRNGGETVDGDLWELIIPDSVQIITEGLPQPENIQLVDKYGNKSEVFNRMTDIAKTIKHESDSEYKIDIVEALTLLYEEYQPYWASVDTTGATVVTPADKTADPNGWTIDIACAKGGNVITLDASELKACRLNVHAKDGVQPGEYSLIINVVNPQDGDIYDREINIDDFVLIEADIPAEQRKYHGDASNPNPLYTSEASHVMFNMIGDDANEYTFKKLNHGVVLAPNAFVITDGTHNGSMFALEVTNKNGEIHQTGFKQMEVVRAEVNLSKRDATNNNEIPGATLAFEGKTATGETVKFTNANVVLGEGASIVSTGEKLEILTGTEATKVKGLPNGHYTLTELLEPAGYEKVTTVFEFDITTDGVVGKNSISQAAIDTDGKTLYIVDAPYKTDVKISKKDASNDEELPGAILTISGTKLSDNSTVVFNRDMVESRGGANVTQYGDVLIYMSGSEPTILKNIPDGIYTLKEQQPPENYEPAESITFKIEKGVVYIKGNDGGYTELTEDAVVMYDDTATASDIPTTVKIKKVDAADGSKEVPGAKMTLTGVADTGAAAVTFTTDNVASEFISSDGKSITWKSGTSAFEIKDLPNGVYTLHEEAAPKGYAVKTTDIVFRTDNGTVSSRNNAGAVSGNTVSFDDDLNTATISVIKTDSSTEGIAGAVFSLKGTLNVEGMEGQAAAFKMADFVGSTGSDSISISGGVLTWKTGSGTDKITNLLDGTYILTEVSAPAGHTKLAEPITITIANGEVSVDRVEYVTFTNDIVKVSNGKTADVEISKKDFDVAGEELPGAILTITGTAPDKSNITFNAATDFVPGTDAVLDRAQTTSTKIVFKSGTSASVIKNLPDGTYTLHEDTAPAGYDTASDIIFTVSDGKVTVDGVETTSVEMSDKKTPVTDVQISKKDTDTRGNEIKGAVLALVGTSAKDSSPVQFDTKNVVLGTEAKLDDSTSSTRLVFISGTTPTTIKNLPDGDYVLFEDTAPAGFMSTTEISFTIEDGKVVGVANDHVEMFDKPYKRNVEISKKDVDGNGEDELPGAILSLKGTDMSGAPVRFTDSSVVLNGGAEKQDTSTETNFVFKTGTERSTFVGLPDGDYTLTEDAAPAGYDKTTELKFSIREAKVYVDSAEVAMVEMFDKAHKTDVEISKQDAADKGPELPGAILTLTGKTAGGKTVTFDTDDVTLGTGAELQDTDDDTSVSWKSGTRSTTIKNLPDGDYTLVEDAAPAGYDVTTAMYFTVENGKITVKTDAASTEVEKVEMFDKLKQTDVEISKKDATTKDELEGAILTLTGKTVGGKVVSFDTDDVQLGRGAELQTTPNSQSVSWKSGTTSTTIKNLPDGDYTLVEDAAPAGYDTTTTINFTIKDGKVLIDETEVTTVEMFDKAHKTDVEISKQDADDKGKELPGAILTLTGKTVGGKTVTFDTTNVQLGTGAELQRTTDNTSVSWKSGTTSTTVKNLPDGDYVLTEDAAPAGYDTTTEIKFTVENGKVKVGSTEVTAVEMFDKKKPENKTDVEISKQDTDERGKELPGAVLTLTGKDVTGTAVEFNKDDVKLGEGAKLTDTDNSKVTWTSGTTSTTIKNLPDGDYTLVEDAAPAGYDTTTTINFTIKDGKVLIDETEVTTVEMFDKAHKTDVEISKQDADDKGKELPGAILTLTGKTVGGKTVTFDTTNVQLGTGAELQDTDDDTSVSWKSGTTSTTVKNLPDGEYTLVEDAAPAGYDTTTEIKFTVENGKVKVGSTEVTAVEMFDKKKPENKTDVEISKQDTDERGKELPGAVLTLTGKDVTGTAVEFNKDDVKLGEGAKLTETDNSKVTWTSGTTSTTIKNLPDGEYTLVEDAAPAGYDTTTEINFTIKDGKVLIDETEVTTVEMFDKAHKTDVEISKQDADDKGKELPGAILTLTGKTVGGKTVTFDTTNVNLGTGAELQRTTDNTSVSWKSGTTSTTVKNLPDGEYTLVEDAAPAGYDTTTEIKFTVENGKVKVGSTEVTAVEMFDKKKPENKTDVEISKQDTDDRGKELPGAVLTLTGKDTTGTAVEFNKDDVKLGEGAKLTETDNSKVTWTSGTTSTTIKNLPDGDYTLVEDAAPAGYDTTTEIKFTVENGKVKVGSTEVTAVEMFDKKKPENKTDVEISKQDADDKGKELPGAILTLTGKTVGGKTVTFDTTNVQLGTGAELQRTTDNTSVSWKSGTTSTTVKNLPDGDYVLTEDAAPAGYDVTTAIKFTVENGKVTVKNGTASTEVEKVEMFDKAKEESSSEAEESSSKAEESSSKAEESSSKPDDTSSRPDDESSQSETVTTDDQDTVSRSGNGDGDSSKPDDDDDSKGTTPPSDSSAVDTTSTTSDSDSSSESGTGTGTDLTNSGSDSTPDTSSERGTDADSEKPDSSSNTGTGTDMSNNTSSTGTDTNSMTNSTGTNTTENPNTGSNVLVNGAEFAAAAVLCFVAMSRKKKEEE